MADGTISVGVTGAMRYTWVDDSGTHSVYTLAAIPPELRREFADKLTSSRTTVVEGCHVAPGLPPVDYKVFDSLDFMVHNIMEPDEEEIAGPWRVTHDMCDWFAIHVHSRKAYYIGPVRRLDAAAHQNHYTRAVRRVSSLNASECLYVARDISPYIMRHSLKHADKTAQNAPQTLTQASE